MAIPPQRDELSSPHTHPFRLEPQNIKSWNEIRCCLARKRTPLSEAEQCQCRVP